MKACGFPSNFIEKIFSLTGVYLGAISITAGTIIAFLLIKNLDIILIGAAGFINRIRYSIYMLSSYFIKNQSPFVKTEIFSKDFYLDKIYTEISFTEILFIAFTALIFSIISSQIPAKKAGKIKPIEVLKNE